MATFTDIYKQELRGKGILNSIGTAALKRTREKLDVRNMLFGGSGAIAATGQKVFGKGYQAMQKGGSTAKAVSENIGTQSIAMDQLLVSAQKQEAQLAIIAKNTMNSNAMARDMNVTRQNIMKLVTMGGGKASRGADMFFKDAAAREASYESQFKKSTEKSPAPLAKTDNDKNEKSLLSTLFGGALSGIGLAIAALGKTLMGGLSSIKTVFDGLLSSFGVVQTLLKALTTIDVPKLLGIGTDKLTKLLGFAMGIATNPVFIALAAIGTAAGMLAYLRGDVDDKRARFLELAEKKKAAGSLDQKEEEELRKISTPENQKASREKLDGYDPITNKIEDAKASSDAIIRANRLDKQSRVAPEMQPNAAKQMLDAGPEFYDGYTKEQLAAWSKGKNAPVQALETTAPAKYNPAMDSQAANVVPGAVSPTNITQQIGGAESLGNYNASFGDRKLGNGAFTDIAKTQTGKSLTDMTLKELADYQATRGANGAVGKYQFMRSTLFGSKDRPGLVQQEKLDINTTKFTPEIQERLQESLMGQNEASLKRMNIPVTPGNMYMAHYIGAGGTKAVHEAIQKDPNMTVADAMISKGYKIGNNPELYEKRVGEFESVLAGRLNKQVASLVPATPKTGTNLEQGSSALAAMTRDMNVAQAPNVVVNAASAPVVSGKAPSAPVASATNVDALELFFRATM
jgi:hypothetical protein